MQKGNAYFKNGTYGGGCFPTTPGIGGFDWDDPDQTCRHNKQPTRGWVGGVMMASLAPQHLVDFGGTSEAYDNHQWADDINS